MVVIMQEGHSFDNYLGTLPYVSRTPYQPGPCKDNDHRCVDGLTCTVGKKLTCTNSNLAEDGSMALSFHQKSRLKLSLKSRASMIACGVCQVAPVRT